MNNEAIQINVLSVYDILCDIQEMMAYSGYKLIKLLIVL